MILSNNYITLFMDFFKILRIVVWFVVKLILITVNGPTLHQRSTLCGSFRSCAGMKLPTGQAVSKPFASVQGKPSFFNSACVYWELSRNLENADNCDKYIAAYVIYILHVS